VQVANDLAFIKTYTPTSILFGANEWTP